MKTLILYRPVSEKASAVERYAHNHERQTGQVLTLVDIDSHEGIELARVHDVIDHPVLLALRDDSSLVQSWLEFDKWPTVSELSYYTQQL